jgi:hypothetical protein
VAQAGQIVECSFDMDEFGLLQQIGAVRAATAWSFG